MWSEKFYKIPVTVSWISKIKCAKGSKIILSKRATFGFFITKLGENGQISYDRTIIQLAKKSRLYLEEKVAIGPGVRVIVGENGIVKIGANTFITSNTNIFCKENISIGRNCAISWNVQIMDSDIHKVIIKGEIHKETKPIIIGNEVWVGSGVNILKGVKIGDGCIIASRSVVTKDIPDKCMVAGNPARIIKENVCWGK